MPDVPDVPDMLAMPDMPDMPDVPYIPDVPDVPKDFSKVPAILDVGFLPDPGQHLAFAQP